MYTKLLLSDSTKMLSNEAFGSGSPQSSCPPERTTSTSESNLYHSNVDEF
jgi:hypothetical protein